MSLEVIPDTRLRTSIVGRDTTKGSDREPRLHVLYVTNQLPFPAHSGGQVREAQLLARLGKNCHIHLAVITESFSRDRRNLVIALEHCVSVAIFEASESSETDQPRRITRYTNPSFDRYLSDVAETFDLIHVEGYFLLHHLPAASATPIFLSEENVEFDLVRQMQNRGSGDDVGWRRVLELERAAWRRAAVVSVVTEPDRATMSELAPDCIFVHIPSGMDHIGRIGRRHHGVGDIVTFVGNYEWSPTRQGADRLLLTIWPRLTQMNENWRLRLVGAGIDPALRSLADQTERVDLIGRVPSISSYLAATDVFVCPIEIGSGAMIKMAEALRAGCAIVANSHSMRGLPAEAKDAVVMAESNDDFVDQIGRLLADPARRTLLAARAQESIGEMATWDDSADAMMRQWESTARIASPIARQPH